MAIRNLGFEIALNLDESVDDRQIFNNLGGGNIQQDIALFRNNLRNTSSLMWMYNTHSSAISGDKFVFPTTTLFTYTNGDEVTVQGSSLGNLTTGTTYYVVDYEANIGVGRNQVAFGLSTIKGGSRVALGTITSNVELIRKDVVTKDNLLNLSAASTTSTADSQDQFSDQTFSYNIGSTFNDAFNTIESNISQFNFLRQNKYASNTSVNTSSTVRINGPMVVSDPAADNTTQAKLDQDNSPGVYITNPFSSVLDIEKTRAFSTDAQPWAVATGKLTTKSTQVNIGDLYFSDGIKIENFDDLNTESGDVTVFDYKLPVLINGVEFFVLVKRQ